MKKTVLSGIMIIFALTCVFAGGTKEGGKTADTVFMNGAVYTCNDQEPWAEAVAVKDGKVLFVGKSKGAEKYTGPDTEVIDLAGKMLMPSFIDSHMHPPGSVITELYNIALGQNDSVEGLLETVREFVEANPGLDYYYGMGWSVGAFRGDEATYGPKKERLDEICSDAPIILRSYDGHSTWVNSKALELAGVTKFTPDPAGGVIERDPVTGEPWGTLKESAADLVPSVEYTLEQQCIAAEVFQDFMHSLGYTGIFSAGAEENVYRAFKKMDDDGKLTMWVRGSHYIGPARSGDIYLGSGSSGGASDLQGVVAEQIQDLERMMETYNSELFKISNAKFFADGVIEGVTGSLLEPYHEDAGKGDNWYGLNYWRDLDALDTLKETIAELNSRGIQVHVHSIGDRATRDFLDAFEYALEKVPGEHRNAITHLQVVSQEDIPRFKDLGIIANCQVYWDLKEPGWWEYVDTIFLGERAEYEYPLGSFVRAGVTIAGSSDCPVTDPPHPLWAIEAGVTRNLNCPEFYGVDPISDMDDPAWLLNKDERVSLEDMIKCYTCNNAYALFIDDKTGTIEEGKYADLVILGENLFEVDPIDISTVPILMTIFHGDVVYESE